MIEQGLYCPKGFKWAVTTHIFVLADVQSGIEFLYRDEYEALQKSRVREPKVGFMLKELFETDYEKMEY